MSEHDDSLAAHVDSSQAEQDRPGRGLGEGASPGRTGALGGAAAAGSLGAVSGSDHDGATPEASPDPTFGPDGPTGLPDSGTYRRRSREWLRQLPRTSP